MTSICVHKQRIGCALTALPRCCSCADKRPLATAYPVYIDGQGMKLQGKRWQRYCWKCRGEQTSTSLTSCSLLCIFPVTHSSHYQSIAS
jgi:hypothetical protein